jgi:uncharacterized protein YbjT (DUF2867 family)
MQRRKGHSVRGIIRKEEQVEDLRDVGATPIICDIEKTDDISEVFGEVDAAVFAAGAGPGSGAERKWTVDRDGAIKLIEAAKKNGIDRYVMISAMGLDNPRGNDVFKTYLRAKAQADQALRNSGLNYTIVKPGRLTDEKGTGKVKLGPNLPKGEIPREDVAAVLTEILETPETAHLKLDLISGDTPIPESVESVIQEE